MSVAVPPPPEAKTVPSPLSQVDNLRGGMLLIAAMALFTIETMTIRWLGPRATTSQAVLFRAFGQIAVIMLWAAWRGAWPSLRSKRYRLHAARGVVSIASWWLYYITFQKLDYALATLLTFSTSLFVVVLAGPVLGEKVRLASWIATLIGFSGILIASGVGVTTLRIEVVLGLISAAFSAAIVFMTRSLAQTEDTNTTMAWIGVFVSTAAVPAAYLTWQPLDGTTLTALVTAGLLGAVGMVLMIEAYGVGEAAVLAPIPFIRIAFAMAAGALFFAEPIQPAMTLGAAIVIGAALYAMRNARR